MTSEHGKLWRYPGARWWRFDFHTHTPASRDTYWCRGDDAPTPHQWLQRFMDAEIDCIAITDHNSGAWIDKLKAAYEEMQQNPVNGFRELHLFPGVEVSVNGGFHLLALFDTEKTTSDIDTLLGAVEYDGTKGDSDGVTRKSAVEVLEAIVRADGTPIPAHVDSDKGLLHLRDDTSTSTALDANTLRQIFKFQEIVSMEVIDRSKPKPALYEEANLSWSEVLGSDCHNFRGQNPPGSRYTWVKMEDPSLEGLRLAMMDGEGFSIRRNDDPEIFDPFQYPSRFVETVEIKEARYMGNGEAARLPFSPWLSALVGGRGTGKSTVVHAIRLATKREHELMGFDETSEPRLTFERFNRAPTARVETGGLSTTTSITLTMMRDEVRYRVRWRCGHGRFRKDDLVVEEEIGRDEWRRSSVQTITPERFPIRIFSQGQIAALAGENQQALLQIIDDAAGVKARQEKLNESRNAFYAARARIRELDSKLDNRDRLVVQRQDAGRKLKRFEESGHTEILKAYRLRSLQRRETDRQFRAAEVASGHIDAVVENLQPEDLPEGLFGTESDEDREVTAIMDALAAAVREAAENLRKNAQQLRRVVETQGKALANSGWQRAVSQAAVDYRRLVELLRAEGVSDPSEYGRLVQERQRLDSELERLESMQKERDRLVEQAQSRLHEVHEARREVSATRDRFLTDMLAQNTFVRIRSRTYGEDARVIERSLREALGVLDDRFQSDILIVSDERPKAGAVAELLENLPEAPEERRDVFEKRIGLLKRNLVAACVGMRPFGGHFNNYLKNEFTKNPEFLDKLWTWFPEDGLQVEYSRRGDGTDFRHITQASAGQRSAAMLAFLLAHGNEPLVLDQPEDDLDNHLIYDLVVRQIRENKLRRQIIVVTHNPNIVVNGDAEMLHALDFGSGQCFVAQSGSLQKESMREEVCRVMEGGREAFERRYRRLGPEPSHV